MAIANTQGPLADYTTLRIGGPAKTLLEAGTTADLVDAIRHADSQDEPVLLIAGGSNLVIGDAGFDGLVVLIRSQGLEIARDGEDVLVTAQAGHNWDALVAQAVAEKWSGIECLSGIPGSAGATPIQNVGAYGQEIAEVLESATVYHRPTGRIASYSAADCRFAYRDSVFKHSQDYLVLDVTYRLTASEYSRPIKYAETAKRLGVGAGETVPLEVARETVLELRRGKGMVLDDNDPDSSSAGSFFINPVISPPDFDALCARAGTTPPHWPAGEDVKVSAAWLIGHAGFARGYGRDGVAISSKHTLALTNRGTGTATQLLELAAEVRDGVAKATGITLRPEPTLVNATIG